MRTFARNYRPNAFDREQMKRNMAYREGLRKKFLDDAAMMELREAMNRLNALQQR